MSLENVARPYAAAGALFVDERERILLVVPTYKDSHDIPGGMVEAGETPREACEREVREEISLDIKVGRLIVVDRLVYPDGMEMWPFIFDGGLLTSERIAGIAVDGNEISAVHFESEDALGEFIPPEFAARLRNAMAARRARDTFDLRWGQRMS
jgi:ADP-ribose pyrophosphatase YjhB (NUDIX family)